MSASDIHNVIIVGAGPAGLSAALALARVRRSAVVLSHNKHRNDGVTSMHNLLSRDGSHPDDFRRISREQIESYGPGIQFVEAEAVRLANTTPKNGRSNFEIEDTKARVWKSKKLILAMGSKDVFPDIDGYADNWPGNIYQCLFCDGLERRQFPIGVLGTKPGTLLHTGMMISHLSGTPSKVTIFMDQEKQHDSKTREAIDALKSHGCLVERRKVVRLSQVASPDLGVDVSFADGETTRFGFLMDKPPTCPIGEKMIVEGLGVETVETMFGRDLKRSEPFGESNVPGVFVAGDAGIAMKAVPLACTSGFLAGAGVSAQLCTEEGEEAIAYARKVDKGEVTVGVRDATRCSS